MTHPSLRSTALVAAAACLLLPGSSHAWDSKIFSGADLHGRAAARTTYQAEHRPIMEQALNTGGHPQPGQWNLPFQVLVSTDASLFNDLLVAGTPTSVTQPWSLTPVEPDETLRLRTRTFTPSMFAELPDFSYSLLDWFSGNESCPPGAAAMGVAANDECYEFAGWMGTLNSTHFPPQSTTLHRYYNELAKGIGAQCVEYQGAMGYGMTGAGPIPPFMTNTLDCGADGLCPGDAGYTGVDVGELDGIDDFLQQCQALTLMLEAVAQHYLQDSWSSGHMWQRWGGPMPPDVINLPRGIMVAMGSGMIHGAKAITGSYLPGPTSNDRMCAGSEWRYAWGSPGRTPAGLATVPTTIPDGSAAYNTGVGSLLFEGVGDLFMGDLNSGGGWIYTAGLPRYWTTVYQNSKTYDCAVMSTRQTYAAGPQIWGSMTPYASTVPGTDDERCLAARATNKRFYQGSHLDLVTSYMNFDNFVLFGVLSGKAGGSLGETLLLKSELKRIQSTAFAARWADGDGYDLSTNTGFFGLGPMMGISDNGAFNITPPPYVDPPAPWDGVQSSLAADPDEEMLLSAFNRSFAKHWCHRDNMDFEKLNNLRKRCQGLGSFGGLDAAAQEANCRVCEEYSARHIRIGCSETDDTYTQTTNVLQPLCAELEDEANVDFLYLDIDPADPMAQDAGLAAADFCRSPTPNFAPCSDPWVGSAFGSGGCSQYYVQFFGWVCTGCGGCALSSSALGRIDSPFPVDDLNILWTATGDGYFSTATFDQEDATLLWNILVPPTCGISASGSASISLQVCDPYYSSCSTNYDFASVTCSGY